jgi:hypothetical protein
MIERVASKNLMVGDRFTNGNEVTLVWDREEAIVSIEMRIVSNDIDNGIIVRDGFAADEIHNVVRNTPEIDGK